MQPTSRKSAPFTRAGRATPLLILAVLACGPLASAADMTWVGNDAFNNSNFSASGNWQSNNLPSWGYGNSLKFNQNQNSNVTGLTYDWGQWRQVNDIIWDTSFPVSRTLSASNGGGIGYKTRIENNSYYTQTVAMQVSGGQDGASDMQLNPVNGSLIISGTIFNDNSKDYVVWGSLSGTNTTTLTLNSALGPNATQSNVDFTVSGGRFSNVQVNASQLWSGTTTVNSGAFTTANGVTLASSAIVVAGGTVASTSANTFADTATLTVNSGRLSVGGSDTVASLAGSGGTVDIASGATLTAGDTSSTSYAGSITGSGGFTKVGSGTFTLTGSNGFTGGAALNAGTLGVGSANALGSSGTISFGGGTLQYSASNTTDYSGRFSNAASQQYSIDTNGRNVTLGSNLTSSGGSFTKLGSGTLTLAGANSYNGGTTISAGRLVGTTSTSLSGNIVNNAEVEFVTNGGNYNYSGTMNGTGTLIKSGDAELTLDGTISNWGGAVVTAGAIVVGPESVQGPIMNMGVVAFATDGSGAYAGAISGYGSVEVRGGDIAFTGTNWYSGATTVWGGGRLSVNGVIQNTAVTVQGGGALGGSGSIFSRVVVEGQGTLSPGNSIASLAVNHTTFTGTSEFVGGSTFEYEYDSLAAPSVGADLLVVSGSLTIGAGSLITFADLAGSPTPFADGTIFALINYSGVWNNGLFTYNTTPLTDGSRFFVGSQEWEIDYNRTSTTGLANYTGDYLPSSSFVAITAVPEPATWAMALTGIACGGYTIFRRGKRA
jgi:autotransporter-associated beta strand protein